MRLRRSSTRTHRHSLRTLSPSLQAGKSKQCLIGGAAASRPTCHSLSALTTLHASPDWRSSNRSSRSSCPALSQIWRRRRLRRSSGTTLDGFRTSALTSATRWRAFRNGARAHWRWQVLRIRRISSWRGLDTAEAIVMAAGVASDGAATGKEEEAAGLPTAASAVRGRASPPLVNTPPHRLRMRAGLDHRTSDSRKTVSATTRASYGGKLARTPARSVNMIGILPQGDPMILAQALTRLELPRGVGTTVAKSRIGVVEGPPVRRTADGNRYASPPLSLPVAPLPGFVPP